MKPIHTGLINGHPVRFFDAPGEELDFPFHAAEDLFSALRLPRDLKRHFRANLGSSKWAKDIAMARVGDELIKLAPHYMAQGVIGAMVDQGVAPKSADLDYRVQGTAAIQAAGAARGMTAREITDRMASIIAGRPVTMPRKFNTETGEVVVVASDAQALFGLSDKEMARADEQMRAEGHGGVYTPVDPKKLETLQ